MADTLKTFVAELEAEHIRLDDLLACQIRHFKRCGGCSGCIAHARLQAALSASQGQDPTPAKCPHCCADLITKGVATPGQYCPSCEKRGPWPDDPYQPPSDLTPAMREWIARYRFSRAMPEAGDRESGGISDLTQAPSGKWRVGSRVPLNVYENDRPMFQCHTVVDAARVVALLNAGVAGEDAALLDWIEATSHRSCQETFDRPARFLVSGEGDVMAGVVEEYPHATLRDAIRAAIAGEKTR